MQDISKIWPEWKVAELVGEGSFGKVYRCVREEYGITYESAVKVITIPAGSAEYENVRSECNSEAEIKSYFEGIVSDFSNEIKLMLMLKGAANIVSVDNYKIIENKDGFGWKIYIFMEYLTSFTEYSKNKIFTETEVKDFALDMLNALNICAKNNIIHRDIKPANIFVDKFGSFKLGDFGVARRLEGSMSMMSKKGTYSYMAPEVFRGEKYDNRADIYSLGMVMYKLLNRNRDPFIDPHKTVVSYNDRNEAIERRRNGEKPPAPVDASPEMAAIILKAIEFRPSDRFASVEELRTAISALDPVPLSEEPTVADTNGADKTVAAGIGLYSSQKEKAATDDATVKADTEEATLVADATLKAATTPDPEATMKADTAHNKPANVSPKAANTAEKEPKNKKKTGIIAAAILVVLAVVAAVAIMSNGGFSKEKPTNDDTVSQSEYTDGLQHSDGENENGEASGEVNVTENNSGEVDSGADVSVMGLTGGLPTEQASKQQNVEKTTKKANVKVTEKATEKVTGHKISEGERLYLEAEKALKNGNTKKAAILFGKSSNYGYSDARKRSFALWDKIAARETISAGYSHTVGLKSDGTVVMVGDNDYGQCNVETWTDIVAVAADGYHTVGLKSDGTVVAVGKDYNGQCNVETWTDIVAVAADEYHTIGLKSDGSVVAVGTDESQCNIDGWTDIVAVSAGKWHTVGLKSDGSVVAVGYNHIGQCDVKTWTDIVAVAAGDYHTVGLKADGTVVAVGDNDDGQCDVDGWTDIVAVATGGYHTVGVKSDGTVVAVGKDHNGQCNVETWTDIVAVAADEYHTVGLKSDGSVVAVGYNNNVDGWKNIKILK